MDNLLKSCVSSASYFLQPTEFEHGIQDLSIAASGTTWPSLSKYEEEKESIKWLRPLGYAERFMTYGGTKGNLTTVYALWLESRNGIEFEAVKKTIHILYKKMPHLRVCMGYHKNDKWWREMPTENIDVKKIKTNDVKGTFESLLKRTYEVEKGPLWFARYLELPDNQCIERDPNFNLSHKDVVIFGFHHNMSDGTTNMRFCDIFLRVLNDVLLDRPIDMKEEGRFETPHHDKIADKITSIGWLGKVLISRIYNCFILYGECVRNYIECYPMASEKTPGTYVLCKELDAINTQRLLKRCKMERVTLNSAFTAAANLGLYRMILQKNKTLYDTQFGNQQAVNMRRYWPKELRDNSFGCHISMLDFHIPTSIEDLDNFWEYAREIHKTISEDLRVTKRALKLQPLSEKLWLAIFANFLMSKLGWGSILDTHYCVTNMGDVSSTFSGIGEEVEVTKILRSVTCHLMQTLCQHTLQTFRGKFYYSLDYYPHRMSAECARAYASNLMDTLKQAIHTPN